MKEYLESVIRSKKEEIKDVEERVEKSEDVAEVRALGDTLKKLRDEWKTNNSKSILVLILLPLID